MCSFLPLINKSVTIYLQFITKQISNHIRNNQYFALFIWILFFNIFTVISSITFKYSIKDLESFKCFKSFFLISNWYFASYWSLAYQYILSLSVWWLIRLTHKKLGTQCDPLPGGFSKNVSSREWVKS